MDFRSRVALEHALNSVMVMRNEVEKFYEGKDKQELLSRITQLAYFIDNLRIKAIGEQNGSK